MKVRLLLLVALTSVVVSAQPVTVTLAPSPHTRICFLDIDGDGARSAGDPLYLQINSCATGTAAGDVRLTTRATYPGGTILTGSDDDVSRSTVALVSAYAYYDATGDGTYNSGDDLYLHIGSLPAAVLVADVPLAGAGAYQPLASDDPRIGRPLASVGLPVGNETYGELDGNSGFSTGDRVYLDIDGDGRPSAGDLRLAQGNRPLLTQSSSSSAPTSGDGTPSASLSSSQSPSTEVVGETGGKTGTPAPGGILAALVVFGLAARRRQTL